MVISMTTNSKPEVKSAERLFLHPGANVETKPCSCGESIEYVRADSLTTARRDHFDEAIAVAEAERCDTSSRTIQDIAHNKAIDGVLAAIDKLRDKEKG